MTLFDRGEPHSVRKYVGFGQRSSKYQDIEYLVIGINPSVPTRRLRLIQPLGCLIATSH